MTDYLPRRRVLSGAAGLTTAAAFGAILRPTVARAEQQLTYSVVGGSFGQAEIKNFITDPGFEKQNNVHLVYDYAQDNIRAAKAIANCKAPIFTIIDAQPTQATLLADGGCIQDYDLDIVTNYANVFDRLREPPRAGLKNFFASCLAMAFALTYNAKEMPEPKSFEVLLDKKLKGRIAIPSFDWIGPQWLYGVNWALGGTSDNLDKGFQFISELIHKNGALVFNNADSVQQAFTRGEVLATPFFNGRTNVMARRGIPVKFAYPKGWIAMGSGLVITKGTRFPKLANLLVNNFLNPEYQLKLGYEFGYPPSNGKAVLPANMADMRIPEEAFEAAVPLDYAVITNNMAKNLSRWNREVLG